MAGSAVLSCQDGKRHGKWALVVGGMGKGQLRPGAARAGTAGGPKVK